MTITTDQGPPPDGSPEAPTPEPSARRGRLLLAAIVLVGLGVGGWWAFVRDDGSDGRLPEAESGSVGTIPPAATPVPDTEGASLLELLEKGRDLEFHASYTATGDPEVLGGELTVEVWRKDGRIRQDTTLVREGTTVRSSGFVDGDDTTTCSKTGDAPWACSTAPDPGTTQDGVFGSVAAQLEGANVVETQEQVAGRDARCFTFPTRDGTGRICLTDDGLPLLLAANGQELLLSGTEGDVDDAVFVPPSTT